MQCFGTTGSLEARSPGNLVTDSDTVSPLLSLPPSPSLLLIHPLMMAAEDGTVSTVPNRLVSRPSGLCLGYCVTDNEALHSTRRFASRLYSALTCAGLTLSTPLPLCSSRATTSPLLARSQPRRGCAFSCAARSVAMRPARSAFLHADRLTSPRLVLDRDAASTPPRLSSTPVRSGQRTALLQMKIAWSKSSVEIDSLDIGRWNLLNRQANGKIFGRARRHASTSQRRLSLYTCRSPVPTKSPSFNEPSGLP